MPKDRAAFTHDRQARNIKINTSTAPIEVIDPHGEKPGDTIITRRQLRDDVIGALHAHKSLSDIQYKAAREMQRLYELCQLGSVQSVDTTKDHVDGGTGGDGNTDQRMRASDTVRRVERALGIMLTEWARDILVHSYNLKDACAKRGHFERRFVEASAVMFAETCNEAAIQLGMMTRPGVPCLTR